MEFREYNLISSILMMIISIRVDRTLLLLGSNFWFQAQAILPIAVGKEALVFGETRAPSALNGPQSRDGSFTTSSHVELHSEPTPSTH
jgi:hypothetical protein